MESVHQGRPTYRPGGHPGDPMNFVAITSSSMIRQGDPNPSKTTTVILAIFQVETGGNDL